MPVIASRDTGSCCIDAHAESAMPQFLLTSVEQLWAASVLDGEVPVLDGEVPVQVGSFCDLGILECLPAALPPAWLHSALDAPSQRAAWNVAWVLVLEQLNLSD
jgi:hypothetical protein